MYLSWKGTHKYLYSLLKRIINGTIINFFFQERRKIITYKFRVRRSLHSLKGNLIKEVRAVSPVMGPKRRAILLGQLASSRQEVKSNVQMFQRLCRQFRTKGSSAGEQCDRREHHRAGHLQLRLGCDVVDSQLPRSHLRSQGFDSL